MKKIADIIEKSILWIALACLLIILLPLVFSYAHINMDIAEQILFRRSSIPFFLTVTFLAVFIRFDGKILKHVSVKALLLAGALIWMAAGCYLILNVSSVPRADAWMTWEYAHRLNGGSIAGFEPGMYMRHKTHQLGFITYERMLSGIVDTPRLLFLLNLLMAAGTIILQWRILVRMKVSEQTQKRVILFSLLFLPHFFFIVFAYGTTPGLFIMVLGVDLLLMAKNAKNGHALLLALLSAASFALSVQLKKNYILAVVALLLCLMIMVFRSMGDRRTVIRAVLYGALVLFAVVGSGRLLLSTYTKMYGAPVPAGEPMVSYIAMGLMEQMEDSRRPNGWYNGYVWDVYEEADCDAALAAQMSKDVIAERLTTFKEDPAYAARFFYEKIRTTWSEPLFQSVWSGPMESEGQTVNGIILQNLYRGNRVYLICELWMHALNVVLFAGCVWMILRALFFGKRMPGVYLFWLIWFLGGFWYHLISETKAQYVYMYLFMMIPVAMDAIRKPVRKEE